MIGNIFAFVIKETRQTIWDLWKVLPLFVGGIAPSVAYSALNAEKQPGDEIALLFGTLFSVGACYFIWFVINEAFTTWFWRRRQRKLKSQSKDAA